MEHVNVLSMKQDNLERDIVNTKIIKPLHWAELPIVLG